MTKGGFPLIEPFWWSIDKESPEPVIRRIMQLWHSHYDSLFQISPVTVMKDRKW